MANEQPIRAFKARLSTLGEPPKTPEGAFEQLNEVYGVGEYTIKYCDMTPIVVQRNAAPGGKMQDYLHGFCVAAELRVRGVTRTSGTHMLFVARVYGDGETTETAQNEAVMLLVKQIWMQVNNVK